MHRLFPLSLTVLLAACSPVTVPAGDAGNGGPDSGPPEPVTVTVFGPEATPRAGALVVFSDPGGDIVAVLETAASGSVTHDLPDGGAVTALIFDDPDARDSLVLHTMAGVVPGDTIELGPKRPASDGTIVGTNFFLVPGAFGNVTSYTVEAGRCNQGFSNDPTQVVEVRFRDSSCSPVRDPMSVLATARDSDFRPVAYSVLHDVRLDDPQTQTFPAWQTNLRDFRLQMTNAPFAGRANGQVAVFRNGIDYNIDDSGSVEIGAGQGVDFVRLFPPSFAETLQIGAQINSDAGAVLLYAENLGPTSTSFTLDLAARLLPALTNVATDLTDPARPALTWSSEGDLGGVTAGVAFLGWSSANRRVVWQFGFPAGAESFTAPELPADFVPGGTWPPPASELIQTLVGFIELGHLADPAAFRQGRGLSLFLDDELLPPTAPAGTVTRISASFSSPERL